jgi:tetratricopeptide (TPR) repeat protein
MSMLLADDPRFRPAMQLIDNAEYAEALRQLDALLDRLSPSDSVVALYWKVICLTSLGELPQARFWLEHALTQVDAANPLRICLELQNAYLLYAEKGPERAVTEMKGLLDRYAARNSKLQTSFGYTCRPRQVLGIASYWQADTRKPLKSLKKHCPCRISRYPGIIFTFGLVSPAIAWGI